MLSFFKCLNFKNEINHQKRFIARKVRKVGKTKLFRVNMPPQYTDKENKMIWNNIFEYRTQVKSIRNYFEMIENDKKLRGGKDDMERQIRETEITRLICENDKENERISKLREQKMLEEWMEKQEQEIQTFLEEKDKTLIRLENADRKIEELQAKSVNFVTNMEDLDKLIEKSLSNIVDHNFALTPDGEKIMGDIPSKLNY
ncbi:unnamed protein product [Gordionus sp. m RMFG-2023]|uniref:small ribosomal subunit protein mS26-like n=1 Tax=Gordionus sp. m RMFG-2023 TaxID=3053472 RepID=UPI0030E5966C